MNKKTLLIIAVVVVLVIGVGVAFFALGTNKTTNKTTSDVKTVATTQSNDYYFKNGELKLQDAKLVITDTKVIPVGEKGNEYGKKPVIAFWFKTTNLSDKELTGTDVWISSMQAYQDNNPNTVNKLEVGGLPDDRFLQTQFEKIKQNGTAEDAIAYELDDTTTPVLLKATKGMSGEALGKQTFNIKK